MSGCFVPLCNRPAHARGLCGTHYAWAKARGILADFAPKHRPLAGRLCEVEGCGKPARGARYCSMHRERLRLTGSLGDAAPLRNPPGLPCAVKECDRPARLRGYCYLHARRIAKTGDPGPAGLIRRPRGTGTVTGDGYRSYRAGGKPEAEHRRVWTDVNGPIPKGYVVHHLNGDKLDNRIENLALLTRRAHAKLHRSASPQEREER